MQQYCPLAKESVTYTVSDYSNSFFSNCSSDTVTLQSYKVEVDGDYYYIPYMYAAETDVCIDDNDKNGALYSFEKKWSDSTTDYIKKVKETLDIDLKKNYKRQTNYGG